MPSSMLDHEFGGLVIVGSIPGLGSTDSDSMENNKEATLRSIPGLGYINSDRLNWHRAINDWAVRKK